MLYLSYTFLNTIISYFIITENTKLCAGSAGSGEHPQRRVSLPPPPPTTVTWGEYLAAEAGHPPSLAREQQAKHNSKSFRATVAMVGIGELWSLALLYTLRSYGLGWGVRLS